MTDHDMMELAKYYARSFGGKIESAADLIMDKRDRLSKVTLKAAIDAFDQMIERDDIPRNPAVRLAVMCRIAGAGGGLKLHQPVQSCGSCDEGFITVPHSRDYDVYRNWNGEYDMVVSCTCSAGRMKLNNLVRPLRSIESYEAEYPHWREEFAVRRLERQAIRGNEWSAAQLAKIQNYQTKRYEEQPSDIDVSLFQEVEDETGVQLQEREASN